MKLILLNLVLAIISSFVAIYMVLSKRNRRSRTVGLLLLGASVWAFGYALEMFSPDFHVKVFWAKFQFIGMALTNVMPIFIAYFFEKDEWVNRKTVLGLSLVPITFLTLVVTDRGSGLIFSNLSMNYIEDLSPLSLEYGPASIAFIVYSYILLLSGFVYSALIAKDYSEIHWRTIIASIMLFITPVASSFFHIFINSGVCVDYTPIIFNVLAIFFSLFVPLELKSGSIFPLDYASILGEMDDAVVLAGKNDRITYVNPAAKHGFRRFFGVEGDDIVGRRLKNFIDLGITLKEGTNELTIRGTSFDLATFTIPDWRGKVKSRGFILRDITERAVVEKKLQILHRYATKIANSGSYEGVALVTQEALSAGLGFNEGCILVFWEGKAEYHNNWGIGDKTLKEVISDDDAVNNLLQVKEPRIVPDLNDLLREIGFGEVDSIHKSMMIVPVRVDRKTAGFLTLYGEQGNIFSEADMNLLEIFAGHVGTAIRGIWHQETLIERQEDEIRMILEGAGRVSSMVRHDLRGPLQTIKNATFILKSNPDKIDGMGPIINKSVDYMIKILEDLQYQDQPNSYNKVGLSLNTLIQQTLVHQMIPEHIKVETDLCDSPVEHSVDKIKIQRMLDNLIRNAVEAMEEGGTLRISTSKCKHGTELRISDTGTGIEEIDKLFTPFHTTKINGMGLGLVSVKQTLDAHGCMLDVESELGEGTTFTIRFPENPDYMGNSATRLSSITAT